MGKLVGTYPVNQLSNAIVIDINMLEKGQYLVDLSDNKHTRKCAFIKI